MLKKIFGTLLFAVILFAFSCSTENSKNPTENSKKDSCKQYKTGSFLYHYRGKDRDYVFAINRNDSVQTETDKKTGVYTKLAVRWTDKCKYELKMIETTYPLPDSIQKIRRTTPLNTEILSFTNDYYIFKSYRDNSNFVLTDTMWIEK